MTIEYSEVYQWFYLFNKEEIDPHHPKKLSEFTHKIEINTFDAAEFGTIEAGDKEIIEEMHDSSASLLRNTSIRGV